MRVHFNSNKTIAERKREMLFPKRNQALPISEDCAYNFLPKLPTSRSGELA